MVFLRTFRAIVVGLQILVLAILLTVPSQDPVVRYPGREVLEDLRAQGVATVDTDTLSYSEWERVYRDPEYHTLDEFLRLVGERNISTVYYHEVLCPSANMVEFYFKEDGGYSDKYYHRSWTTQRIPRYPGSCTTRESPFEIFFENIDFRCLFDVLAVAGLCLYGWMLIDLFLWNLYEAKEYVRELWDLILLDTVILIAVIYLIFLEGTL